MLQFGTLEKHTDKFFKMIMQGGEDHKQEEERAAPTPESNDGALETNMSMEEERTIVEWISNNPFIQEN
eukprot:11483289-Heterocapsa_arctica.AAC.1